MLHKLIFWRAKAAPPLDEKVKEALTEQNKKDELLDVILFIFLLFTFVVVLFTYTLRSHTLEELAWFGDSFGLLTSIFTGFAFAGLILSINLQRKAFEAQKEELELTRSEMKASNIVLNEQSETLKLQQFENTFFKLIEYYEKHIPSAPFLEKFKNELNFQLKENHKKKFNKYDHLASEYIDDVIQIFMNLHAKNTVPLNTLTSKTLKLIDFIEEKKPAHQNNIYINILIDTLSAEALLILFYHSLSRSRIDNNKEPLYRSILLESTNISFSQIIPEHWTLFNSHLGINT